jgi:ABC-type antimicrobial peptide transport system permease subunit
MIDIRVVRRDAALAAGVRSAIESMGHHYPLRIQTIEERAASVLAQERMMGIVSAFFGGLALLLAAIGIYGVTSYSVTRRTAEIGVRMALGARPADVLRLVLNEVGLFLLAGIAAGVPATLAASRLVSGMVYGISEKDPVSIALTIATLTAVSICAAYLPARRAVNADPLSALRCE